MVHKGRGLPFKLSWQDGKLCKSSLPTKNEKDLHLPLPTSSGHSVANGHFDILKEEGLVQSAPPPRSN